MSVSLKVKPVCGRYIAASIESAFRIAISLDLEYTDFDFNGIAYAAYPDGRAIGIKETGPLEEWTRTPDGWAKRGARG